MCIECWVEVSEKLNEDHKNLKKNLNQKSTLHPWMHAVSFANSSFKHENIVLHAVPFDITVCF